MRASPRLALALLLSACAASPPSALYVVVESDLRAPEELDSLHLSVEGEQMTGMPETRHVAAGDGPLRALLTLRQGSDPTRPVRIVASARLGERVVLSRLVRTSFSRGTTRELRVRLSRDCLAAGCTMQCDGGVCVDELVDPETLPLWPAPEPDAGVRDGGASDAASGDDGGVIGAPTCVPMPAAPVGASCDGWSCVGPYECDHDPGTCRVIEDTDALTAGRDHTCAWRRAGSGVVCWGEDAGGGLGCAYGGDGGSSVARVVGAPGLSDAVWEGAGDDFTCAVRATGVVRCWGDRVRTWASSSCESAIVELALPGALRAERVDAGDGFACALGWDGGVYCWGEGASGELGRALASSAVPVRVEGPSGVAALSLGAHHACALGARRLWCWGANDEGQLGAGDVAAHAGAVEVADMSDAIGVAAGEGHTCALLDLAGGERVLCWGADDRGQLDGTSGGARSTSPVPSEQPGADAIVAGVDHTCVHAGTGVRCWGRCDDGQCGPTPLAAIPENEPYVAVAAGRAHTSLLGIGGWCLGDDELGQCGEPEAGELPPYRVQGFR